MTIGLAVGLTVGGAVIFGAIVAAIIITKKAATAGAGSVVTSSTIGGNTAQVQDITIHSFKGWKFMIKRCFWYLLFIRYNIIYNFF